MIPKTIHFYWGRNIPLSFLRYMSVYSFAKLNPEWEICVWYNSSPCLENTWTTDEQKINIYYGEDYFDKLKEIPKVSLIEFNFNTLNLSKDIPEVIKSDILRLYLVYKYGGFFSGIDILYVNPIEQCPGITEAMKTAHIVFSYFFLKGRQRPGRKAILGFPYYCFFGGLRNETVFGEILDLSYKRIDLSNYQSVGILLLNEYFNFQYPPDLYPKGYIFDITDKPIFPLSGSQYHMYFQRFFLPKVNEACKTAIGLHWFAGGKGKQNFENLVSHQTLKNYRHVPIFEKVYEILK